MPRFFVPVGDQVLRVLGWSDKSLAQLGSEGARLAAIDALELAQQKRLASRTLWDSGQRAEGLRLAVEAVAAALRAGEAIQADFCKKPTSKPALTPPPGEVVINGCATDDGAPDSVRSTPRPTESIPPCAQSSCPPLATWKASAAALEALGVASTKVDMVTRARERLRSTDLPRTDGAVGTAHRHLFEQVTDAYKVLESSFGPACLRHEDLLGYRAKRVGVLVAAVVVLGLIGWRATIPSVTLRAVGSAHLGDEQRYSPNSAVDNDLKSEWLLPDETPGWLELEPERLSKLHQIRILNARNPGFSDRGTKDYRIELYFGSEVVETIAGQFQAIVNHPSWVTHPVTAAQVDKIRIHVDSYFERGGGIAEVELD